MRVNDALLVHAGALGDFVMALSVVAALRASGARRVTVLGRPAMARLAQVGGLVDDVIDFETGGWHALFAADHELGADLRDRLAPFDCAVNMLGGPDDVSTRRLRQVGIGRVIGLDPSPRDFPDGHVTDQWLTALRDAGLTTPPGPPVLRMPADLTRKVVLECGAGALGTFAVLHPGSGGRSKCWPLDRFCELACALATRGGRPIFLTGPVEDEVFSAAELQRLRAAAPLVRGLPLIPAAALIGSARLYVGNDGGMSHVAATLGVRTVVVFGPTEPRRWRPLGRRVRVVVGSSPRSWPDVQSVLYGAAELVDR